MLEPKEEVVKLQFQFLIPANSGVATFSLQKVPESAGDSGVFFYFFYFFFFCCAVLSLVFELKQNLEAQPYPEMNPKPPKGVELLWSSIGKIISSRYPTKKKLQRLLTQ